jgi:hypothetical protein
MLTLPVTDRNQPDLLISRDAEELFELFMSLYNSQAISV